MEKVVASILITTFKRPHLLKEGLKSIARQKCKYNFEVIILNDGIPDETEEICKSFEPILNIKYVFTGQRNVNPENINKWRVPGFAFNIGAKMAQGDIIFLSCAEMFHMGDSIEIMTNDLLANPRKRVICDGKDDVCGDFLRLVIEKFGNVDKRDLVGNCGFLNNHLPFFMGLQKSIYFEIGGYDEDFIGVAWEDNDFIYRLESHGVPQWLSNCCVVHLWHKRLPQTDEVKRLSEINRQLFYNRRGNVVRNAGVEWGKL